MDRQQELLRATTNTIWKYTQKTRSLL